MVNKDQFESEWRRFREDPENSSRAWKALLFIIISLGCLVSNEYDQKLHSLSVLYEQRAWEFFTKAEVNKNPSITGLKAFLLLSYTRAYRGTSISALTRMAWRVAEKLQITVLSEKNIFNGIVTLFSLNVRFSQEPKQEWVPKEIALQIDIYPGSAMNHTELDVINLKILRFSPIDSKRQLLRFVKILEDFKSDLEYQQNRDHTTRSLSHFARNVLRLFQEANWYRSGAGSFEAAECALSLTSSTVDEDLSLLDRTKKVLKSIAPCSNTGRTCFLAIEEAMECFSREDLAEAYGDTVYFVS